MSLPRAEVLHLAQTFIYGQMPDPIPVRCETASDQSGDLDGSPARIRLLEVRLGDLARVPVLLVSPDRGGPFPGFLGLNFTGNHTLTTHPSVPISPGRASGMGGQPVMAASLPRGSSTASWDLAASVRSGFAVATACYYDLQEDDPAGTGLLGKVGKTSGDDRTGAIAIWAWGLSRLLDALRTLPDIDTHQVAVVGHSRLGKTALLAGAWDPRFAAVMPSQSGTGGVAPHIKTTDKAESVRRITSTFPHWFAPAYARHADHPHTLPVTPADLLRICAPRKLLVCNAVEDLWADPEGQFAQLQNAADAWPDRGGLNPHARPVSGERVGEAVAYFLRPGGHAMTPAEWTQFRAVHGRRQP